jgi:microcystin-dependent protein
MAEETTNNLAGKRVSTTFRGLLHLPHSIDASLAKQTVYDGQGTPTALSLGGDTQGANINGSVSVTGTLHSTNNLSIDGDAIIAGDVSLTDGGNINDVVILSAGSSVNLRTPSTTEVGKLRIRETAEDFELLFGNPDVATKNLFSIIVKKDSGNNLYIKNNYSDLDINSPLWINRSTGDVNIKNLKVSNITSVLPPGVVTPPGQETNYGKANRNVIPVGMICMFPVLGIPNGWIACDGKQHNKITLPELFNVIGYNYSVLKSGDLFQVPDYRGLFVRGLDYKRSDEASHAAIDPQTGRALDGSVQQDQFKSHTHTYTTKAGTAVQDGDDTPCWYQDSTANTGATGGDETRPKNVVALYCIKW